VPREVHRHKYKDDRLIRTVVTREVEWDDEQVAWMLALTLYRSQLGPCGHYMPHATADDAEERYVSPEPRRCHACTAAGVRAESYKDSPQPQALLYHAERR